jgi:catechol 2,3-dioxygenase-like lactoylglutathione lyase family enzyme
MFLRIAKSKSLEGIMGPTEPESTESTGNSAASLALEMRFEVVVMPVSDVDRAKGFYEAAGFVLEHDYVVSDDLRVVQMTPSGSACSIVFGSGVTSAEPGSADGMLLVVQNLESTRDTLVERGIDVSELFHDVDGRFHHAGMAGRVAGKAPNGSPSASWASFVDPDGNRWFLQEIPRGMKVG